MAGFVVSVVSVVAVVWWALRQDPPELPDRPREVLALIAAVGFYAIVTALRGERWRALLLRSRVNATRADCQALTVVGYGANNVLPARGGDVLRASLLITRTKAGARTVIGTLVAERVLDTATLVTLFAFVGYVLLDGVGAPSGARFAIVIGGVAALAALGAGALALAQRHRLGRRIRTFIEPMANATFGLRGRHGAAMAAATLAIWALEAGVWYLTARAAGLELDAIETLYLLGLVGVFLLVPAGPGYVGTLDAALVFGVKAIGGSGSDAVSYLLLLRFVLTVPITLAGLVVLVTRYGGWRGGRAGVTDPMESGA